MNVVLRRPMTVEQFLIWENQQALRYEFDGFQPVAMTGGTAAHAFIQSNLLVALGSGLRGKPCRAVGSELKIQAAVASGAKMVVPSPDTCERQAAQFAGNMPRLQGQREWPALLRMLDRLDPSYKT